MSIVYSIGQSKEIVTHLMKLLTTTMYENKYEACFREILSNALDANIGQSQPVTVDYIDDTGEVLIRDYGSGMSYDFVLNVFTVFGSTTKANDKVQIGGFGIGAKTIFIYPKVRFFTIHEGIKYEYETNTEDQIPGLILISKSETNEPSGTGFYLPYLKCTEKILTENIKSTLLIGSHLGKISAPDFCTDENTVVPLTNLKGEIKGYAILKKQASIFYLLKEAITLMANEKTYTSANEGILRNYIAYEFDAGRSNLSIYKIDNNVKISANRETVLGYHCRNSKNTKRLDLPFLEEVFEGVIAAFCEAAPLSELLKTLLHYELCGTLQIWKSNKFPRTAAVCNLIQSVRIPNVRTHGIYWGNNFTHIMDYFHELVQRLESSPSQFTIGLYPQQSKISRRSYDMVAVDESDIYEGLMSDPSLVDVTIKKIETKTSTAKTPKFSVSIWTYTNSEKTYKRTSDLDKIRSVILKNGIITYPSDKHLPYPFEVVFIAENKLDLASSVLGINCRDRVIENMGLISNVEILKQCGLFCIPDIKIKPLFSKLIDVYSLVFHPGKFHNQYIRQALIHHYHISDKLLAAETAEPLRPRHEDDSELNCKLNRLFNHGFFFWDYDANADCGLAFVYILNSRYSLPSCLYCYQPENHTKTQYRFLSLALNLIPRYEHQDQSIEDENTQKSEMILAAATKYLLKRRIDRYGAYLFNRNKDVSNLEFLETHEWLHS